jgi:hypothetical protein
MAGIMIGNDQTIFSLPFQSLFESGGNGQSPFAVKVVF